MMLATYRTLLEQREREYLHPAAALSLHHQRLTPIPDDHRLPYRRDVDRIMHSKAYARYADKTQVVYLVDNDHITHRSLHVQLVSNFARGIAEMLRLNVDLVEAIALGHDVGHPPFGHEGEGYLSELSQQHNLGAFAHPWQSCRLLQEIEPLNLGFAVYDGFLCHDGGMSGPQLVPAFGKTWDQHLAERASKLENPDNNLMPATLEGCLVKICDTISYLGKDIEDAITLGLLERSQVPANCLGSANRQILSSLAEDLIFNSYDKEYIAISDKAYEALCTLRAFNFKHIYMHPALKSESKKIKRGYKILFETLRSDWESNGNQSHLWQHFLRNKNSNYISDTLPERIVIDYISGMTDNFFIKTLQHLTIPTRIELAL
jgi:dGTPase